MDMLSLVVRNRSLDYFLWSRTVDAGVEGCAQENVADYFSRLGKPGSGLKGFALSRCARRTQELASDFGTNILQVRLNHFILHCCEFGLRVKTSLLDEQTAGWGRFL